MNLMADKENAPRKEEERGASKVFRSSSQDTVSSACQCPRSGDLWQCAGRPELVSDPDGRRCELGGLVALGTDHDVRGELAALLAGGDRG